jgi:hypothetical protein
MDVGIGLLVGLLPTCQHADAGKYQDGYLFHIAEFIKFASNV